MTKIKINVTQEILKASQQCGYIPGPIGSNCAIALAVREIFSDAWVEDTQIIPFFKNDNGDLYDGYNIALPEKATLFISAFDSSSPEERVELNPFSFEIEIPEPVINQLAKGWEEVLKESETLELV